MHEAANPFDYRTIADVLITIEYAALASDDYRRQVIRALDPRVSADRPFSFRSQFADQWYDLHNPDQVDAADRMKVTFETRRDDFPPNADQLTIQHVILYFARADGETFEVTVNGLRFTPEGAGSGLGGTATTV